MLHIFLIIFLVFFILFSAFLSASETSFFSLSSFTVKNYKQSKDQKCRQIASLLEKPRELLVTIMMLNVLSNILVQNIVSNLFGNFSGWLVKVGVPLVLVLVFGDIIPKSVALPNKVLIARKSSGFLVFIEKVLGPVRVALTNITSYISRILFFFLKKEKPLSSEELQLVLNASEEKGIVHVDERHFMSGYLDLKDSIVKERMKPREDVVFYSIDEPISSLESLFDNYKYSRLPVCKGNLEKILGIVSLQEFLFHREDLQKKEDVKKILKKPFFIPESTPSLLLLEEMREKKETLAIVVDEYGSTSGLVTEEDLIEAIVGEISEEGIEKKKYTLSEEDVMIANGKLELDEFEDVFNIALERKTNVVTLGGWLTEQMEKIPKTGEKYETKDCLFYVLSAEPSYVKQIYVRRLKKNKKI